MGAMREALAARAETPSPSSTEAAPTGERRCPQRQAAAWGGGKEFPEFPRRERWTTRAEERDATGVEERSRGTMHPMHLQLPLWKQRGLDDIQTDPGMSDSVKSLMDNRKDGQKGRKGSYHVSFPATCAFSLPFLGFHREPYPFGDQSTPDMDKPTAFWIHRFLAQIGLHETRGRSDGRDDGAMT